LTEKQDRFIILKKIKYGEADLIIHAIGANGAKTSFLAKSALKSKKRFGGGILEPLHFVNLTYKEKADSTQMKTLNEATLIDDFKEIRSDYDKLELALFILNCVSHVSLEGDQNSEFLFNLTGHSLRAVAKSTHLRELRLHFCLKFLYQQGVISIENWMTPFLKANMNEAEQLAEISEVQEITEDYVDSIETMVIQYIKTADSGY
jgi:DNA repair protein RecO (recombination protein O)